MNNICPNCNQPHLMDRRKAFLTTAGMTSAVAGMIVGMVTALLHHPFATWIAFGWVCESSICVLIGIMLKPKGEQMCMNCGYKQPHP